MALDPEPQKHLQPPSALCFGRWLFLLAAYFVLIAVGRILVSDSAELDEAEQLVLTQSLAWGYGSQPPLYTWLLWLTMAVVGVNITALALFKAVLMFGMFGFAFLCVKQITGRTLPAFVAMMTLFFLPQILWESQRDLTHSVLATTLSAATLYVMLRMIDSRRTLDYLLFGVCAAAGLLSKYNYAVFLAALVLAALTMPQGRAALLNWRTAAGLGVMSLLVLPHVGWMLTHHDALVSDAHKIQAAVEGGLLKAWTEGVVSLGLSVVAFAGSLVVVALFLFGRGALSGRSPDSKAGRVLIGRCLLIGLLLCLALVFCFHAQFKQRWMQPLLFAVPLYFTLLVESRLSPAKARQVIGLAVAAALAVLVAVPAIPLLASVTGRPTRLNAPYAALAAKLKQHVSEAGVILADSRLTGGNLRLFFKHSAVFVPEFTPAPASKDTAWLITWDATRRTKPPARLMAFVSKTIGDDPKFTSPFYVEAPLKYLPTRSMKLGCMEFLPKDDDPPRKILDETH